LNQIAEADVHCFLLENEMLGYFIDAKTANKKMQTFGKMLLKYT
jgi:hypothetical protein